jgi:hypothetical protein
MLDLRPPALESDRGALLARDAYHRDFWQRDAEIHDSDSWKFERGQHFDEQDDPSREALRRGNWDESMRLLESERDSLLDSSREDLRRGSVFHRVRVVEQPLTPYLQWELHSLRLQAECGMPVRVVDAAALSALEREGPLPEVVTLGGRTLYRILYTDRGIPDGAIRFTDRKLVARWDAFVKALYLSGEDVITYVDRCVAHLPPPHKTTE